MRARIKAVGVGIFMLIVAHHSLPASIDVYEYLGRLSGCVVIAVVAYFYMKWRGDE